MENNVYKTLSLGHPKNQLAILDRTLLDFSKPILPAQRTFEWRQTFSVDDSYQKIPGLLKTQIFKEREWEEYVKLVYLGKTDGNIEKYYFTFQEGENPNRRRAFSASDYFEYEEGKDETYAHSLALEHRKKVWTNIFRW